MHVATLAPAILVNGYLVWQVSIGHTSWNYTLNQGCMSLSTSYLEYGRHFGHFLRCRRRRQAYAPMSNIASHDNHENINSWVSIPFQYEYGAPLGGPSCRWSSAIHRIVWFKNFLFLPDKLVNRHFLLQRRCRNTLQGAFGSNEVGQHDLKAPANEDTLLRTHCCQQMFPRLPARATFVVDTNFVSGTWKMFLILFRHIFCPQQMFHSLRSMEAQHSFCVQRVCAPEKHHEQQCVRYNVSSFARALM